MVWLVLVERQPDMSTDEIFVVVGSDGTGIDILLVSNWGLDYKSKV